MKIYGIVTALLLAGLNVFGAGATVSTTNGIAQGLTISGSTTNSGTIKGGSISGATYSGNGNGITNVPPSGISTNGSSGGQVLSSIGGVTVWTNAPSVFAAASIATNTAVYSSPATTVIPGTKWTNTFNARASLEIVPVTADAIGGTVGVNFKRGLTTGTTNDSWNVNYFIGLTAGAFTMTNQPWVIPDMGTNEWFLFTDLSTGGGTFTIATNRLHLK